MRLFAQLRRDESGFSLSELLIAGALIVVVTSGAWAFSYAVTQGSRVSEARGVAARDTATPLMLAEKYVMQALALEETGPYRLVYRLDRDLSTSATAERQTLEATSDGRLLLTSVRIDSAFNELEAPRVSVLSTHAVNVAQGQPLFTYYDSNETEITSMGYAPSQARSIRVRLYVQQDEALHYDSRLMTLRNRE